VRIEPKNPPPPINFVEWDGLVRLCFNRKNKTLSAIFRSKALLKLLEENLRTQRALLGGTDGAAPAGAPLPDVSQIIDDVLESTGFAEQRSAKMDIDDFLLLLSKFNEAGLHFSGGGSEVWGDMTDE